MPAHRSDDPLIPLPVRFPTSLVARMREQSTKSGTTMSDMLRSYLSLTEAKPLGKPVPRRRPVKLAPASTSVDPALLRQLASIGSNLNQIAHQANATALTYQQLDLVQLLAGLNHIEAHLRAIADHHRAG